MKRKNNIFNTICNIFMVLLFVGLIGSLFNVDLLKPQKNDKPIYDNVNDKIEEDVELTTFKLKRVDNLPSENIEDDIIYVTPKKFTDVLAAYDDGATQLLSELVTIIGSEVSLDKPINNINESSTNNGFYIYYILSENNIFVYGNFGAGLGWFTVGDLLSIFGFSNMNFNGEYDGNTLYKTGYYAFFINEKYFQYIDGEFFEVGKFNTSLSQFLNKDHFDRFEYVNHLDMIRSGLFDYANIDYLKIVNVGYNEGKFTIRRAFDYCKIKTLYLSHLNKDVSLEITSNAFEMVGSLKNLVLDFGSFLEIEENVFDDTPIATGKCFIYVPDDLVETVKNMEGWKTYSSQIKPLSEYVE